jgi:hypothetical protein
LPTQSLQCIATYTITQNDVESGSIINTAGATAVSPTSIVTGTATAKVPPEQQPSVSLVKSVYPVSGILRGDLLTYTLTATNDGNVTINNVTISDDMLGLSALRCDRAQPTSLQPGESYSCSATYRVPMDATPDMAIVNQGLVAGVHMKGSETTTVTSTGIVTITIERPTADEETDEPTATKRVFLPLIVR